MLQTVGVLMFLSSCCICSSAFLWDPQPPRAVLAEADAETIAGVWREPGRLGVMLLTVASSVGGLALASFGLGLQAERRRAAWGATVSAVSVLALLLASGVGLWLGETAWLTRLWHALLTLVMVLVTGFTIAALRQVQRHPPPRDVDVVAPGQKVPYSFYHEDPPEVRLARDLAERRAKLEAQQRELEQMERDLRDKDGPPP